MIFYFVLQLHLVHFCILCIFSKNLCKCLPDFTKHILCNHTPSLLHKRKPRHRTRNDRTPCSSQNWDSFRRNTGLAKRSILVALSPSEERSYRTRKDISLPATAFESPRNVNFYGLDIRFSVGSGGGIVCDDICRALLEYCYSSKCS